VPFALLGDLDLTQAYLIGANLTNAYLYSATLTHANLTNANLTNAYLYAAALTHATLTHANLTNAYLTNADLYSANQANADLTDAYLYSATLTGANLTHANLTNAYLRGTTLTGADLRGSQGLVLGSATTTNTILPDGTIQGLYLDSNNPSLLVRNYGGNIPIHILQGMSMIPGTSLVFQLDAAPWGSTISFDSGIPVTLNGNLELGLAGGVDPASLLDDSFHLFDWTGVSPSGQLAQVVNDLPAGYSWDTSQLYTLGEVALVPEPGTCVLLGIGGIGLAACGAWQRRRCSSRSAWAGPPRGWSALRSKPCRR
jgi:hypothetical protein